MTKKQFDKKFDKMLGDAIHVIREKVKDYFGQGAIDITSYEDDYLLPKIVLCATLQHCANQYEPFLKKDKDEVENLRAF